MGEFLKVGDYYRLPCGHTGRVFMVLEDGDIVVKSQPRHGHCDRCSVLRNRRREPIAFIISLNEAEDHR